MENNNGRGIFYGVIGVATLVVAIIGATFAYFSAEVTAFNNLTTGTANIALGYNEVLNGVRNNLIPIDTDDEGVAVTGETASKDTVDNTPYFAAVMGTSDLTKDSNGNNSGGSCLDDKKNEICSTYQFTITNESPSATWVYGYINQAAATTITDLHFAIYAGTPGTFTNPWDTASVDAASDVLVSNGTATQFNEFTMIQGATRVNDTTNGFKIGAADSNANWHRIDNASIYLQPYQSVTYTVVLWVEEIYENQTFKGHTFEGNIKFNTGSDTGVTGQLNVG